jgi:sugar lactone lactonase YvrE
MSAMPLGTASHPCAYRPFIRQLALSQTGNNGPVSCRPQQAGRVYSSSADGLKVYNVSGDLIGAILVYNVANFAFGGPENDIIYILNDSAIYAAHIAAKGAISQPE